MIKFCLIVLSITFIPVNLFASESLKDGFYVGIDPAKNDESIGKLDNSIPENDLNKDQYYGYKFSEGGFFLAPELFMEEGSHDIALEGFSKDGSDEKVNYDLKANIGYDFNKYFSGFISYDLAKFSYDSSQGVRGANIDQSAIGSTIGIGSQVNFSDSFGIKVLYSQQESIDSASGNEFEIDSIEFGTVYSF